MRYLRSANVHEVRCKNMNFELQIKQYGKFEVLFYLLNIKRSYKSLKLR